MPFSTFSTFGVYPGLNIQYSVKRTPLCVCFQFQNMVLLSNAITIWKRRYKISSIQIEV